MSSNTHNLSKVQIDKDRLQQLKVFAAVKGTSMASLIAIAVDKILSGEIEA
jgi:hypothetical protein